MKKLIFFLTTLLAAATASAQMPAIVDSLIQAGSPAPPVILQQRISSITAGFQSAPNPDPLQAFLQSRAVSATVTLASTDSVAKIAVMLGSNEGSNDIFYKEFEYGATGNFSDGTSCEVLGNTLTFGIGSHRGTASYVSAFAIYNDSIHAAAMRYKIE